MKKIKLQNQVISKIHDKLLWYIDKYITTQQKNNNIKLLFSDYQANLIISPASMRHSHNNAYQGG